jgi:4-amino-4-deoxy-L-arabinose transferase-like glycosyltransferase
MRRIRETLLKVRGTKGKVWSDPLRLLIGAAIFHVVLTIAIYGVGRSELFPGTFDQNGIAISVAPDSVQYRADITLLSELLWRGQIREWRAAIYPVHVKLYSICSALFGPLFGLNIISVEPLNVLYYLITLMLVFRLGREAFNRRAGLLAAGMVALWPSYLLHTTQFLKDPLFVAGLLGFVLILLRWLTRVSSWRGAILAGAGGGLLAALLWLVRDNMGELLIATALLGAAMLIARQFALKRLQITNLVGLALLVLITISVQQLLPQYRRSFSTDALRTIPVKREVAPATSNEALPASFWSRFAARVGARRQGFIMLYPDSGSNLDSHVQLNSMADIVGYLPRAAVIGFFAPFPNMWFESGNQVGSTVRLLGGIESLAMYMVEVMAIFGLWRWRRRLSVWLLWSVAATGLIALGLVVANIGALFRLRLAFLMLIIILGAEGLSQALGWLATKLKRSRCEFESE